MDIQYIISFKKQLFIQRRYVTCNMTKYESTQYIIMHIIKRLKHRIASCPIGRATIPALFLRFVL